MSRRALIPRRETLWEYLGITLALAIGLAILWGAYELSFYI